MLFILPYGLLDKGIWGLLNRYLVQPLAATWGNFTVYNMKNDKIIWYKTFYDPMEANIIRAKLEDSGFHCFLNNEIISTLQPLNNQAYGGIKLMVFERDTTQIDLLLAEHYDLETAEVDTDQSEPKDAIKKCENCGSANVAFGPATRKKFTWWVMLVSLCLGVYPFKGNKCYHCFDCGHEFR